MTKPAQKTPAKKTKETLIQNRGTGLGGIVQQAKAVKSPNDPLYSLTLDKIDTVYRREIEQRGHYANASYALYQMSLLCPPLAEIITFWQSQISTLSWTVNITEGAEETLAQRQKEVVTARFNRFVNLQRAIKNLSLFRFYGFSACKILDDSLAIVPIWGVSQNVQWLGSQAPDYSYAFNPEAVLSPDFSRLEKISTPDYVLCESDNSILLALLRLAFKYRIADDEWDKNLNNAGRNQLIVSTPPQSTLTDAQKTKLEQLLIAISEGQSAWIEEIDPANKITIQRIESCTALTLYKDRLSALKTDIISLVSASTLNNQTGATGLGSNVAEVHKDTLLSLVLQDAQSISEALDEAVTLPALQDAGLLAEGETALVYFSLAQRKSNDAKGALELAKMARDAGQEIESGELKEMTGLNLVPYFAPAPTSPVLTNAEPVKSPASAFMSNEELQDIDKNLLKAIENLTAKYMDDEKPVDEAFISSLQDAIKSLSPDLVSVEDLQKALESQMLEASKKAIVEKTAKAVKEVS